MVKDSVGNQPFDIVQADGAEEHEIVQRKELPSRPTTTYGYLESEENAVSTILIQRSPAKIRNSKLEWSSTIAPSYDIATMTGGWYSR